MTGPDDDHGRSFAFTPARRNRAASREEPARQSPPEDPEADLERGRTLALLATLGRMQLRLDVMAREQSEALAAMQALLGSVDARLAALEDQVRRPAGPPAQPLSQ